MYHHISVVHTWYDNMDIQLAVKSTPPQIHDLGIFFKRYNINIVQMKTQSKNAKKHRRSSKNLFWLARDRRKGVKCLILFHRKPSLHTYFSEQWRDDYVDGKWWESWHDYYHLDGKEVMDRFSDIDYDTEPVPVKLILAGIKCWDGVNEVPDLYIQRYRDCLFIGKKYYRSWIGGNKKRECINIPHAVRISNKLFPDLTEESGIVGVKIVPYYGWKETEKLKGKCL